jgi:hypothetical protein
LGPRSLTSDRLRVGLIVVRSRTRRQPIAERVTVQLGDFVTSDLLRKATLPDGYRIEIIERQ